MLMKSHSALFRATLVLLTTLSAYPQQYHLTDVTPANLVPAARLTGATRGKQVGGGASTNPTANLFTGNSLTAINLLPFGYGFAQATAISSDGQQQCGWGSGFPISNETRAGYWSGSSASWVELGASGYAFTYCLGIDAGIQAGFAQDNNTIPTRQHAYLWRGSVQTAVDLHPATPAPFSRATATRGAEQVGFVSTTAYTYDDKGGFHSTSRAYRWAGTAASANSLHPTGFDASEATSTNGTQQGGWGYTALSPTPQHALIWSGSAESATDLHPAGFTTSAINALNASQQAGEAWSGLPFAPGSVRHAIVWSGSAATAIDLNQFLPAGYTHAVATGIDEDGNIAGYAYNDTSIYSHLTFAPLDAIAVLWSPGPAPAVQVSSVTATPASVAPGALVQVSVNLSAPAPAGGTPINFYSTNLNLAAHPAPVTIPEGAATVTIDLPALLLVAYRTPTPVRIYASDGGNSQFAAFTVVPPVYPTAVSVNSVEGGQSTTGSVSLNIPAQGAGAAVSLTSGNPALLTLPASVTVPANFTTANFTATTASIAAATTVPFSAAFNGQTVNGSVTLNPAPALSLTNFNTPSLIGGQTVNGSVTLNTYPRAAAGATVTLTSSDAAALQVPATVTVAQGATVANFAMVSRSTSTAKTVTLTATLNGATLSNAVTINPTPTVTILSADYDVATQLLKIHASTSYIGNSVLTFGIDGGGPIGTLALEAGTFKGSITLAAAPRTVTVWNSNGGQATAKVALSTATYKISISKNGKGTVTASPAASSYPAGTVVTLTATPDPGSPWIGWSGACTGTSTTCTLTMNTDKSVTANFR